MSHRINFNTEAIFHLEVTKAINELDHAVTTILDSGASGAQTSGWASYVDTLYTPSNPFTLTSNTDTILPNNAGTVIDSQKPLDIGTFYNNNKILGNSGDALDIMIYFKALPTATNQWLDVWLDIGGTIGELYRQTFTFPKGVGEERGIVYGLPSSYNLGTWEANGASVYIRSNAPMTLHSMVYNIDRNHKGA